MKKLTKCTLLFFILFYSTVNYGQAHYFNKYEGIPIIAHTNLSSAELILRDSSLSRMHELGIYGFYAVDINQEKYNIIKNSGLKIFPQQIWVNNHWVTYYSEGKYFNWEAEGKGDGSFGNMQIDFNPSLAELTNDGKAVITKPNAPSGEIFTGPYTPQMTFYKEYNEFDPKVPIQYKAAFKLKLLSSENINFLQQHSNDVVCTLKIYASNPANLSDVINVTSPLILTVGSFIENNQLISSFKEFVIGPYNLNDELRYVDNRFPIEEEEDDNPYTTEFIQYKVNWNGLSYAKLAVDNIVVYDERAEQLFYNAELSNERIINTVNEYKDTTYILGWFGYNEPDNDSYLCFRRVNEIIDSVAPGLNLYTTFSGVGSGRFTWRPDIFNGINDSTIYPGYEFIKKSGLNYISINLYNYHWPYVDPAWGIDDMWEDVNYKIKNIEYVTDRNLEKLITAGIPVSFSSQSGRFYDWESARMGTCYNKMLFSFNPGFGQLNYHINLGLLFGAKELTLDPVFTIRTICSGEKFYREGLIDYDLSGAPLTDLGIDFKNTIKPRLSGLFGKTLRKLNQAGQTTGINLRTGNYCDNYIDTVRTNAGGGDTSVVDIGLFSDSSNSDKKYLMLLSRWYNTSSADRYSFLFKTYRNWVIYDYIDSLSRGSLINSNNKGYFEDTISTGDAGLYRIYPVVKYGGEINHDETVISETLTENDLTINSGKTLTVNGTYDCYKNIIVNSGGKLDIKPGSTLNFHNGSKIVVNGLFTANGKSDSSINIDFQSVSGNPLNGIFFGNNSSGCIDYCTIENGYYGVSANSCSLIIKNSEIRDCSIGVYMYNTSYYGNDTEINGCSIKDNTYWGIEMNNASPLITDNTISGSMVGVRCINNSAALLGKGGVEGYNDINDVDCGVYSYSSDPFLGYYDPIHQVEMGGYNSIVGSEYHAWVEMYSDVTANLNWWGTDTPKKGFLMLDDGYVDYLFWLESSPFGESQSSGEKGDEEVVTGKTVAIPLEGFTTRDKYRMAVRHYLNRDKPEARLLCNSILDEEGGNRLKYAAMRLLVRSIDQDSVKRTVINKINNTLLTTVQSDYNAYLEMTGADMERENYVSRLDVIMTKYRNTAYKPLILFRKFSYLYFEEENRDSARVIATIMEDLYPDHELTKSAKMMFGVTTLKKETEETPIIPKEYKLYQNYPNPFNPVTTIKYELPANSKVTLTIYDILGKEVTKLVDKEQEAGKHEVNFNSGKLASGVYVYRIKAGEFMMSKKMMLVK